MRAAALGQREPFARVVERHGPAVFRLLRAVSSQETAAQDAFQEAFVAAFEKAATFNPDAGSLRTWLLTIARNALRRDHRRQGRLVTTDPQLMELGLAAGWGAEQVDPEGLLGAQERRQLLSQALGSLPLEEREVLLLRDVEGITGAETAQLLGISLAAMKSRLHRARLKLLGAYRDQTAGVVAKERTVGGLRCSQVLAGLSHYIDGDLSASEVDAVEAHLRGCSVCERFGGRFSRLVHEARSALGATAAIDPVVVDQILSRLSQP